ncbi:hypothetical protein [Methylomonas sp. CM2]|uniref:C1 family peptidase n=1 Tax=Methylomonas sp. CM2 TaxID=3417647 RepID=UPI003CEEA7EC
MATSKTQLGRRRDVIVARDSLESGDAATAQPRASRQLNIIAKQKLKPFIPGLRPTPDWNHSRQDFDTDNASVGAIKHFELLDLGKRLNTSRVFLNKASRALAGDKGNSGSQLRDTMKALMLFGVTPEQYHPYDIAQFDQEPSAFCYAFAQRYKAVQYYRLDPPGTPLSKRLNIIKTNLAANLPSIFGFTVYSAIYDATNKPGEIPYPGPGDKVVGGHAVVDIGYDDAKKIGKTKGALLIRNSWGETWMKMVMACCVIHMSRLAWP